MKNKQVVFFSFVIIFIMASAAMIGCKSTPDPVPEGPTFPSDFIGTWRRDFQSPYTSTITIGQKSLEASNQERHWELLQVSGDLYVLSFSETANWTSRLTIRLVDGKLEISNDRSDGGTEEDNWNGIWRKIQ
jgi:hypothetical protein